MGDHARIVVGVDGSPAAAAALREANLLAERLGAQIEVITCWEVPVLFATYSVDLRDDDFIQQAKYQLDRTLEDVYGGSIPDYVSGRVVHGGPPVALVRASKEALMLVLGRRGLGGFMGLLLGSVSAACVAHAACPVLVVGEHSMPDDTPADTLAESNSATV
jgi:nucleotide-binding universal stress UspA family protein